MKNGWIWLIAAGVGGWWLGQQQGAKKGYTVGYATGVVETTAMAAAAAIQQATGATVQTIPGVTAPTT